MTTHLDEQTLWHAATADAADRQRRDAEGHAAECSACRAALDEARAVFAVLEPAEPVPTTSALERVRATVLASHRGSRRAWSVAWLFVGVSATLALAVGSEPGLFANVGVKCWVLEQVFAALAFFGAWRAVRRWPSLDSTRLAALAAGAALLGHVYLHFRCEAAHALPHLFSFHVLGVVTALLLALLLGRRLLARMFASAKSRS
jgi:hypothetical protein